LKQVEMRSNDEGPGFLSGTARRHVEWR
jgi:hypothetical protein